MNHSATAIFFFLTALLLQWFSH